MHRRHLLAGVPALIAAPAMATGTPAQPLVAELFTSQSCNSCPPADALLVELARDRPELLVLSFHVTYWDNLGWRDSFSLEESTRRQRRYAATIRHSAYGPGQIYTPQLVVQGRRDVVGSNRRAVLAAIAAEAEAARPGVALQVTDGATATVQAGEGRGTGTLLLVGYDPRHVVPVRGGENGGRSLTYANVVRGIATASRWQGQALRVQAARPPGERLAVLLQSTDGDILAAARA